MPASINADSSRIDIHCRKGGGGEWGRVGLTWAPRFYTTPTGTTTIYMAASAACSIHDHLPMINRAREGDDVATRGCFIWHQHQTCSLHESLSICSPTHPLPLSILYLTTINVLSVRRRYQTTGTRRLSYDKPHPVFHCACATLRYTYSIQGSLSTATYIKSESD